MKIKMDPIIRVSRLFSILFEKVLLKQYSNITTHPTNDGFILNDDVFWTKQKM